MLLYTYLKNKIFFEIFILITNRKRNKNYTLLLAQCIIIISNTIVMFQYNSLLTYTVRINKVNLLRNKTGKITIDYNKNNYYMNGNASINFNETPNKVS